MIARALTFIGQAVIAGAVAFRWLVWRPASQARRLADEVNQPTLPPTTTRVNRRVDAGGGGRGVAADRAGRIPWIDRRLAGARVGRIWLGRVATLIAIGVLLDDLWQPRAAAARHHRLDLAARRLLFLTTLASHSAGICSPRSFHRGRFCSSIATSIWVGGLH